MVKFIRRFQQPFMIGFAIVSMIALAGLYSHTDFLEGRHDNGVAEIYGQNVTLAQAQRAGRKADLSMQLGMMDLYRSLAISQQDAKENFIWNSMVLRHETERLGIEPTEDEIVDATKAMPVFQNNGVYDSTKYTLITQIALTPRGFTTDDLAGLIGDDLRLKKLKALLGSTVAPSESEVREAFVEINQKTQASVVRFKFDEFLSAAQVPDEDVKKLYEERKGSLKTDEFRKVKLVDLTLPTTDKPLQGKARADALTKLQKQAEDFAVAMTEKNDNFDEVAAKQGLKVQVSPDFPANVAPDILGASPQVAAAAYKLTEQEPNSDVVETPRGYYVLQLAGVTLPRPLTFEEAKANLTDTLKHERAQEALSLKASETRTKSQTR